MNNIIKNNIIIREKNGYKYIIFLLIFFFF